METVLSAEEERASEAYDGFFEFSEFLDRCEIEAEARDLLSRRNLLPVVEVRRQERQDNARTALMEAMTASGHLSRVEISGKLEDINRQVLSRLLNGWDDRLPTHEKQRRFAELCNELVIQSTHNLIRSGQIPPGLAVAEISDYPLSLDDQTAASLGYRPSNSKGMVRSTHLRSNPDGSYTRVIEQVSRSNGLPISTYKFLMAAGLRIDSDRPADLAVLEAPFVYSESSYGEGVVDIVRLLDSQSGSGVRFGDSGDNRKKHVSYEKLRKESARREQEVHCYIETLADLEQQLDGFKIAGQIDEKERLDIFKGEIDRILTAICTVNPSYAPDTFGQPASDLFEQAALLSAAGANHQAQALLEAAHFMKQTVTFCGISIEVEKAHKKGLKVNTFSKLLELAKENWKWKKGLCVVKDCPDKARKVEVGPCSVCRKCQKKFDKPRSLLDLILKS